MKLYVLYVDMGWDGCSEPKHVTTSLMEAKLWKKKEQGNDYKEFVLKRGDEE